MAFLFLIIGQVLAQTTIETTTIEPTTSGWLDTTTVFDSTVQNDQIFDVEFDDAPTVKPTVNLPAIEPVVETFDESRESAWAKNPRLRLFRMGQNDPRAQDSTEKPVTEPVTEPAQEANNVEPEVNANQGQQPQISNQKRQESNQEQQKTNQGQQQSNQGGQETNQNQQGSNQQQQSPQQSAQVSNQQPQQSNQRPQQQNQVAQVSNQKAQESNQSH